MNKNIFDKDNECTLVNKLQYDSSIGDWIIDTDPGVDDAFALTLALNKLGDKIALISIESGNVGATQCFTNAMKLCVINNKIVNISKGNSLTISTMSLRCFPGIHGKDGLFDFKEYNGIEDQFKNLYIKNNNKNNNLSNFIKNNHSAVEIIKICKKYKKENKKLNLLTLGPLTNIALAFMLDPSIVDDFNLVCIMGGSYLNTGNISPSGEFNFACDNIAAKIVLDNFKNISVYCWDPAVKHLLYPDDIIVKNNSLKYEFITKCINKKMEWNQGGVYADLGAAISCFFPKSISEFEDVYADIVIDSSKIKQSMFIVNSKNIFSNKNKSKIKIIKTLDIKMYHKLCNEMIDT